MSDEPEKPRLVPAQPREPGEGAAYMPRLPWHLIILGTVTLASLVTFFVYKEQRKATQLRADIERIHSGDLADVGERYLALRKKLEGWILEAGKQNPDSWADKRLRVPGLRGGKGLYLRIPRALAGSPKDIARGAVQMDADVIMSCLGMAPASARTVWERGDFLLPEWTDDLKGEPGVMKLRVKDEVLANHIKHDLPNLASLLSSDWFMLVLQHGESRRDDPVDVFLWDLRTDTQLLRARIQAKGLLMPMHIKSEGAPRVALPSGDKLRGGGATDCSIASQLKEVAGMPAAEAHSAPDSGAADGGVRSDAGP